MECGDMSPLFLHATEWLRAPLVNAWLEEVEEARRNSGVVPSALQSHTLAYANNSFTTRASSTPVNRWSRPWNLNENRL
jgi:hypothetical protein